MLEIADLLRALDSELAQAGILKAAEILIESQMPDILRGSTLMESIRLRPNVTRRLKRLNQLS